MHVEVEILQQSLSWVFILVATHQFQRSVKKSCKKVQNMCCVNGLIVWIGLAQDDLLEHYCANLDKVGGYLTCEGEVDMNRVCTWLGGWAKLFADPPSLLLLHL